jgi:3-oxoacyl-[acyl-carrier protein] reductase
VLVNNSGGPPRTTAVELTDDLVEEAVELLLLSVVRLTRLCLPYLATSGRGRVINVTSSSVREQVDELALSNAVRPGVVGWAKTLAREAGPQGITVNSIAPGRIDTARLLEGAAVTLRLEHVADAAEVVDRVRGRVGRRVKDELEAASLSEERRELAAGHACRCRLQ